VTDSGVAKALEDAQKRRSIKEEMAARLKDEMKSPRAASSREKDPEGGGKPPPSRIPRPPSVTSPRSATEP